MTHKFLICIVAVVLIFCTCQNHPKKILQNPVCYQDSIFSICIDTVFVFDSTSLSLLRYRPTVRYHNMFINLSDHSIDPNDNPNAYLLFYSLSGEIIDSVLLPKTNDGYGSYSFRMIRDEIYLMENDELNLYQLNLPDRSWVLIEEWSEIIYDDGEFRVLFNDHGEWGCEICLENLSTNNKHIFDFLPPNSVNRIENNLYITSNYNCNSCYPILLRIDLTKDYEHIDISKTPSNTDTCNFGLTNMQYVEFTDYTNQLTFLMNISFANNNQLYHVYMDRVSTFIDHKYRDYLVYVGQSFNDSIWQLIHLPQLEHASDPIKTGSDTLCFSIIGINDTRGIVEVYGENILMTFFCGIDY